MQSVEKYEQPESEASDAGESEGASEDSEIQFRVLLSRNNKPKRPDVEKRLLCDKVRKMRDHMTNKH